MRKEPRRSVRGVRRIVVPEDAVLHVERALVVGCFVHAPHVEGVAVLLEDAVVDEHIAATVRLGDRPRRRAAEEEALEKCV